MQEFKLPDLGEGMQEAEIRRWLIQPGDTIKLDQPMVEVETDKAVVEIPSPLAGRVAEVRVPAGQVAKLGEVLVLFDTSSSSRTPAAKATTDAPDVSRQALSPGGAAEGMGREGEASSASPARPPTNGS